MCVCVRVCVFVCACACAYTFAYTHVYVDALLRVICRYSGAYGSRLNMMPYGFNSILIDRGDRVSIQGDGHPTMAAVRVPPLLSLLNSKHLLHRMHSDAVRRSGASSGAYSTLTQGCCQKKCQSTPPPHCARLLENCRYRVICHFNSARPLRDHVC